MASWPGVKNTPPARVCKTLIRASRGLYTTNPLDASKKYMASWPSGKARVCKTLIRGGVICTPQIPSTLYKCGKVILASWPSGKARVCKTLIRGSNPLDASESCSKGQLLHFHFGFLRAHFFPLVA